MEEDFSIEKPRISKLTGPNYRPWSVQVQRLLVAQGLWKVVSQGLQGVQDPEPPTEASGPVTGKEPIDPNRTEVKDAKASTIIMGLCGASTLQHILLLGTAKEQWEALKALYSPLGLQQLGAKLRAFTAYEPLKNANATVTTVATEIDTLQAEIGDIDPKERPSENAKTAVFLRAVRALDPRFDPLILQLEISDTVTKYAVAVTKLAEFERRLGPKEPIREDAFSATNAEKPPRFQGKCYNCGRTGHKKQACRSPIRAPDSNPSTGPLPTPLSGDRTPEPRSTAKAKYAVETSWAARTKTPRVTTPRAIGSLDELLWVVDSGASRHMTYCRDAFVEYTTLQAPIVIQTANGAEIQAIGQGTVVLKVPNRGTIIPIALTEVLYAPGLAGSLISVVQLQDKGISVQTTGKGLKRLLFQRDGRVIGEAELLGKAFILKGAVQDPESSEDRRLGYSREEEAIGEVVTVFDPIGPPIEEPELSAEPSAEPGAEEPRTTGSNTTEDPERGDPRDPESSEDDTIVVDTGHQDPESVTQPRRSGRARALPQRYSDTAYAISTKAPGEPTGPEQPKIPSSEAEALSDPLWKAAIEEEITKLQALGTWEYTKLPLRRKTVGCKWVFTVKNTPTGLIDHYKARLVAQGFSQLLGDDYLETFSPTIRAESLRTLLAIGALYNWEIRQIDVVSAYPRAQLHATVYMRPPRALNVPPGQVLQLLRPLYGLKQSGREWYLEACRGLKTLGFSPCYSDPSVFTNKDKSLLLGLYVDDILILGASSQAIDAVIQGIQEIWEIKDLGDVSLILGLKVERDRAQGTLTISQSHYIQDLISKFRLQDAKPISTPVGDRNTLITGTPNEPQADQALYQQAIGSLMWVAKGTRPDIMYAVGQLSQHCSSPTVRHWNSVLRVLRYLKGTIEYSIQYGPETKQPQGTMGPRLQGYCDADYAGDLVDRKSVTGHLFMLNKGPISWTSTKQRCVATSTTHSEYIALSEACKQGEWLRALLRELQRTELLGENLATSIFSDNQACIALAKDPVANSRTKHIDVRYHYIRELVVEGKTAIDYCPTVDMTADILTKPLTLQGFQRCRTKLLTL